MRRKLYATVLFIVILTTEIVIGKETNKPKGHKSNIKKNNTRVKNGDRTKRSIDLDDEDKPFWANRGKKQIDEIQYHPKYNDFEQKSKLLNDKIELQKEPFWGTRGRRDELSSERNFEDEYPDYLTGNSNCKHCYGTLHHYEGDHKNRREDISPFWGNRGRRSSDEIDDSEPFWGNRGRRQDDDPFWGMRGRRKMGSRGLNEEEPFWGNRGRRDDSEPFWGTRGRRQDEEPFWGNRGRRQDEEPFWGNRGRRKDDAFWGSRGRRKENLKESILRAINDVESDIENLSRMRRSDQSFWSNRGRDSKISHLFNGPSRNSAIVSQLMKSYDLNLQNVDPNTLHDSRIYADEPGYIVVDRSSRSSAEEDPFFISRGKKYYLKYNLLKAARDRRGAIEEIVKSVRNDPYYIARGKKDGENNGTNNDHLFKVKDLVCSAIEMIIPKGKVKREIDSDRDRRTILKKLAAQLQIDPYYVSRGKKSDEVPNEDNLRKFVTEISQKCV